MPFYNFFAITFTDTLHGYIPVNNGSIIESSDGGVNWQTVLTGTTNTLSDIVFPTPSIGYSVGLGGVIVKTVNAGNTWSVITSPTTDVLRGVCFLNPDTGFISGQGECIYRTTDGGATWLLENSGFHWLRKFSFPTLQTGYCVGDNLIIYKTTDGGLTWNQLPGSGGPNLTDVTFLTVDTGYVCGYSGYVAKTSNGGLTWQILNTGTATNFEGLWVFNTQNIYCVGTPGIIMHTTDGGTTWTQETSNTTVTLKDIYFINPNKGFIAGFAGILLENCLPAPGTISGPTSVCQGDTGKIYSVNAVPGATGYNWSLPPGVTITSGNSTNSITVEYSPSAVSGSFSVNAFTAYCPGAPSSPFPVTVNTSPIPTLSGPVQVCFDSTVTYSTQSGMNNYSWNVSSGGSVIAGGSISDNTVTVTWNTIGSQTVSVNYRNINGCLGAAPVVTNVTVNPLPIPTVNGPTSACVVSTGNIYTTVSGQTNYAWSISSGGVITAGGTNTDTTITVTWNTLGTQHVFLNYTNASGCHAAVPVDFSVSTTPSPAVDVTIASTNNVCSGTQVTYAATPINGGIPSYQWKVNGVTSGTNSSTFTYVPVNNDAVTCILTSSITNCISNNPATSNTITMVVIPTQAVSVSIMGPNSVCTGASASFTATPTSGGLSPAYQWKVNGSDVGTNSANYSYIPVNGDIVTCVLTSNANCPAGNPATSNTITMNVNPNLPAGISIVTPTNPFCPGFPVTFNATPVHGGVAPSYQWKVNGTNAGTNSDVFTYNPADGDSVRCVMTSSLSCVSGSPATSTDLVMSGSLAPIVTFAACFDTITMVNAKPIKLKGGIPLGGTYSGPGVNSVTGYFNPATAGAGPKTITYSYTNAALCTAAKTISIHNLASTIFTCGNSLTDVRDSKTYQTIQIGSQCWMSEDLNYGTEIPYTQDQRDNCIAEKYHNPASSIQHPVSAYQWDEMMQYDATPANQGFCPPAWHIPTENDWNILFANYTNSGLAGSPLKYSGFSGFNALLSGLRDIKSSWDLYGFACFYWSSTAVGSIKAWSHSINGIDPSVYLYPALRTNAFSVRCVQD